MSDKQAGGTTTRESKENARKGHTGAKLSHKRNERQAGRGEVFITLTTFAHLKPLY